MTEISDYLHMETPTESVFRVLVCGGRAYNNQAFLDVILDRISPTHICHGGANGADALAGEWARDRGIGCVVYPADWRKYGKRAGPIRNGEMLLDYKPDLVVAFPGGKGTDHMILIARSHGFKVYEPARDVDPRTGELHNDRLLETD